MSHHFHHVDESKNSDGSVDQAKAVSLMEQTLVGFKAGENHLHEVHQFTVGGKVARLFITDK